MKSVLDSIRKVRDEPRQANQIYAQVLEVDYSGKHLRVQIGGVSQWVSCAYPLSESLGTKNNRAVVAGGFVQLARWHNDAEYVAIAYRSPRQYKASARSRRMGAPTWSNGFPRIVGTNLEGAWSIVSGATAYEVWYNSVPSANGAKRYGTFYTNHFSKALNIGELSELITNGGFESGDFTKWTVAPSAYPWTIQSAIKHTGNYAAKLDGTTRSPSDLISSDRFEVVASRDYIFSMYLRCDKWYDPINVLVFKVYWLDSSLGELSSSTIYADDPVVDATFHLVSDTVTAQTGARYAYVSIDHSFGTSPGDFVIYVDDVSAIGTSADNPVTSLYAVRAIDANGNASPFSTWLQPIAQTALLGTAQLDATRGLVAASATDRSASRVFATDGTIVTLSGGSASAWSETPSGSINGVNVTFTLAHAPASSSLRLYQNGLRLREGSSYDYTLSGNTITMTSAPQTGDWLMADYVY